MKNKVTFNANLEDMVQSLEGEDGEATASLAQNPSVNYIKFTLTDDKPNGNKQRVPQEEFPNIINSGLFMPIKKGVGKIKNVDHKGSYPLGVITHLKQVDDKIKGIATLWSKERPEDVEQIKEVIKAGKKVDISWELTYDTEASEKEDEVTVMKNVFLTAATIVGLPAYKGRTQIEAFASKERKEDMTEEEEEEEKTNKELTKLKSQLDALKEELDSNKKLVAAKDTELSVLKTFKEEIEKVEKERTKLNNIKQRFTSAKITKDDKYFEENKDKLLSLDESTLDFMLQDLKVFTTGESETEEKDGKTKIPPVTGVQKQLTDFTPKSLGDALRESLKPSGK